jgi:hypothetical protein
MYALSVPHKTPYLRPELLATHRDELKELSTLTEFWMHREPADEALAFYDLLDANE